MKDARSQERYEDALFALLMQQMWEGQEQEEQDQPQEVTGQGGTDELDRRCLGVIRKYYGKAKARKAGKTLWKVVRRAAIAACLAITIFAVAYATSEKVRVNTKNLLITVFPTNTELRFPGELAEERSPSLSVGWVPERYTLTEKYMDLLTVAFDYEDDNGNILSISCQSTDGLQAGIDTENAAVENVSVQGCEAMLIEKNGRYHLVWPARDNTRLIIVWSHGITREEILAVAEALAYD